MTTHKVIELSGALLTFTPFELCCWGIGILLLGIVIGMVGLDAWFTMQLRSAKRIAFGGME